MNKLIQNIKRRLWGSKQLKVFCIGYNKTGTTSLRMVGEHMGFKIGDQRKGELLLDQYAVNDFSQIIDYCSTADFFQDIPFSLPNTYQHLHKAFPESKFILSERDNPDQWYQSLVRFHSKLFGNGEVPSANQLKEADYVSKGWMWKANSCLFSCSEKDPYNKELLVSKYLLHNSEVKKYFAQFPDQLLVINISKQEALQEIEGFLKRKTGLHSFPHLNRTT